MCLLQNTRVALDHLESIPEKQCLMENFKDLEVSSLESHLDYSDTSGFLGYRLLCIMSQALFCSSRSHSGRGRWWSSATPNTKRSCGTCSTSWTSPNAESKSTEYDSLKHTTQTVTALHYKNELSNAFKSLYSQTTTHTFSISVTNCTALFKQQPFG